MAGEESTHLEFSVRVAERAGGGTEVTIFGELDIASAPQLRSALERAVDADGEVELDMRACSFIDSTGIAVVVRAARSLSEDGRTLRIKGVRDRVRGILELAGLLSSSWVVIEPERGASN